MTMLTLTRFMATAAVLMTAALPAHALKLPLDFGTMSAPHRAAPAAPAARVDAPVLYAQASDPVQRINQLEEDNRRLNGKLEELSFQVLQLQEQLRKTQEDNEFRFQDLEGKGEKRTEAAPAPAAAPTATAGLPSTAPAASDTVASTSAPTAGSGDEIGGLLSGGLDTTGLGTSGATPPAAPAAGSTTVASIKPGSEGELYGLAYNYMLAGDYNLAENAFRQYADTYPDAADAPDAQYWLGESLFQQAKYTDAAEVFLTAQKTHPKSPKAPEMMLKLGMSLAKLDNRDTACVTFKEVAKRYPQMSANVKKKLQAEAAASNC
ncbi:tol-pal system protein YbgF [Aureimonas sp. SA4125]|uniref:tol-pal system protein YbgF n=1 Tax=Aureimonas sp. SA4125 TaxID=2826993 RepID=UPI001CC72B5E|nr:tol-pal system protein YbgF [Aureimonas sp. SA4125]BDA83233.1 tol-pal system protein YbgF [Aureimonas sp. SA4125]